MNKYQIFTKINQLYYRLYDSKLNLSDEERLGILEEIDELQLRYSSTEEQ